MPVMLDSETVKNYDNYFKISENFYKFFNIFLDLNLKVNNKLFFGHSLDKKNFKEEKTYFPFTLSQITVLYNIDPLKYKGMLTKRLLEFFGFFFKNNVIFITCNQGFLMYILVMQTNKNDRTVINNFFADNLDDLPKYQYYSTDYNPTFDNFKLMTAKTHINEECSDIILTFY